MNQSSLLLHIRGACRASLADAGYHPRAGDIYTRQISEDVLGWLGLNRAVNRQTGTVELNPVIGVRHQGLEKAVAELLDAKPHAYIPATLSTSLGYLMPSPRYRAWIVADEAHVEETVAEMVDSALKFGSPYMEGLGELRSIVHAMESGAGIREYVAFRLPVGYLLLDQPDRAAASLQDSVNALMERRDAAAESFRDFATRLQRRLRSAAEG